MIYKAFYSMYVHVVKNFKKVIHKQHKTALCNHKVMSCIHMYAVILAITCVQDLLNTTSFHFSFLKHLTQYLCKLYQWAKAMYVGQVLFIRNLLALAYIFFAWSGSKEAEGQWGHCRMIYSERPVVW